MPLHLTKRTCFDDVLDSKLKLNAASLQKMILFERDLSENRGSYLQPNIAIFSHRITFDIVVFSAVTGE